MPKYITAHGIVYILYGALCASSYRPVLCLRLSNAVVPVALVAVGTVSVVAARIFYRSLEVQCRLSVVPRIINREVDCICAQLSPHATTSADDTLPQSYCELFDRLKTVLTMPINQSYPKGLSQENFYYRILTRSLYTPQQLGELITQQRDERVCRSIKQFFERRIAMIRDLNAGTPYRIAEHYQQKTTATDSLKTYCCTCMTFNDISHHAVRHHNLRGCVNDSVYSALFGEGYQQYLRTIKVCAYITDEATLQEKCDLFKTWLSESSQRMYAGSAQAHDLHDSNIGKYILPSLLDSNDRIRARILIFKPRDPRTRWDRWNEDAKNYVIATVPVYLGDLGYDCSAIQFPLQQGSGGKFIKLCDVASILKKLFPHYTSDGKDHSGVAPGYPFYMRYIRLNIGDDQLPMGFRYIGMEGGWIGNIPNATPENDTSVKLPVMLAVPTRRTSYRAVDYDISYIILQS